MKQMKLNLSILTALFLKNPFLEQKAMKVQLQMKNQRQAIL
jgi:hypothetical protein